MRQALLQRHTVREGEGERCRTRPARSPNQIYLMSQPVGSFTARAYCSSPVCSNARRSLGASVAHLPVRGPRRAEGGSGTIQEGRSRDEVLRRGPRRNIAMQAAPRHPRAHSSPCHCTSSPSFDTPTPPPPTFHTFVYTQRYQQRAPPSTLHLSSNATQSSPRYGTRLVRLSRGFRGLSPQSLDRGGVRLYCPYTPPLRGS